jgi:hypothetical protein
VALIGAYALWTDQRWAVGRALRPVYLIGIGVFVLHATEEFRTGFQREMPALFGGTWTNTQFVAFNAVWLVTFVIAAVTLSRRSPLPVLVVLFFMLAGCLGNGVMHLLLAVQAGGYFPGAWTAPLCFLVGIALCGQLYGTSRAA